MGGRLLRGLLSALPTLLAVAWLGASAPGAALAQAAAPAPAGASPVRECPPPPRSPDAQQLQAAQEQARDRGMLWRLTRDGRVSYLYGTVHIGRLEWIFPGPVVRAALAATDTLALELDLADPSMAQAMQASLAGQPDALPLPQTLQRRLTRQIEAACLPQGMLENQHPLMQAITLTVLAGRWEGLEPGYAQEIMLAGAARAAGLQVISLETVALQVGALIPAEEATARAMLDKTLQQLESGVTRRTTARLAQAWAEGRLAELEQYERWCECMNTDQDRELMRRLNDDRNPKLARRIDALHGSGKRVFAAVGALHMTGLRALPGLLAQRGFTVERVAFPP